MALFNFSLYYVNFAKLWRLIPHLNQLVSVWKSLTHFICQKLKYLLNQLKLSLKTPIENH